jgi:hypothetical protein
MIRLAIIPAAILIAAATVATSHAAGGCANGYKPVRIQGNWVCQIDAQASTKLKAPGISPTAPKQKSLAVGQ